MQNYFDASSTTPLDLQVSKIMQENFAIFGNENSQHFRGFEAKKLVEKSLQKIADYLQTTPNQLFVTYSGTDANRRFIWECRKNFGIKNLWCSAVEHSSISEEIENHFDPFGDLADIPSNAKMISLMQANSETGIIFDSAKIREKFPKILLHRDHIQSVGKINIDFQNSDAISFAPHKFYGPKMIGLLWLKNPQLFPNISTDNHTKNAWLISGMAKSFELLFLEKEKNSEKIKNWQTYIEKFITKNIPDSLIRHQDKNRVLGITNVSFKNIRGGELAEIMSRQEEISISTGSACISDILQPTPTIKFFESNPVWQFPVRISLHKFLTSESVHNFCEVLAYYVAELRKK